MMVAVALLAAVRSASAQHLWWDAGDQKDATCVYGQITALVTHENTYYCGINWHPGEPAGGYCGIQHNGGDEHRTIFSIWDTSPELHPKVTAADARTMHGRFGGEGEGGHTHMIWPWKVGETFSFYVTKTPGATDTTDVSYYVYDCLTKKWIHSATIQCPNGGHDSVTNLTGGGIDSFLENFSGQDKSAARLALYRLWAGTSPETLKPLTHGKGDGQWGVMHDSYFLANGSQQNLDAACIPLREKYGKPQFFEKGKSLDPLTPQPVPDKVIEELKKLPVAPKI